MACLLSVLSCTQNKTHHSVSYDTLSIPIATTNLTDYTKKCVKGNLLVGYNHTYHSYDLYDLSILKPVGSIRLEKEGPEGVSVGTFTVFDSLIIAQDRKKLVVHSLSGEFQYKVDIMSSEYDSLYLLPPFSFGNNTSSLTLQGTRIFFDLFESEGFSPKYLGYFDFNEDKFYILPKGLMPYLSDKYGVLSPPDIVSIAPDKLMLSTMYSDTIFITDIENQTTNKLYLNNNTATWKASQTGLFLGVAESGKRVFDHYITNRKHNNVCYFPKDELYSTVVNENPPEDMFDKSKQFLCFYDKEGNEVLSEKLSDNISPFIMKWKDNLLLQIISEDESTMKFLKVSISATEP